MTELRVSCTGLLALALLAACGRDTPNRQVTSPDVISDASGASNGSFSDNDNGFRGDRDVAIRDDCDPRDPAWAPTGGCNQRRGDVTFAEFNAENNSPLALAIIGHMAWRMDPTYLKVETGKAIRVRNEGGRTHTFTRVAQFGGGKVPPLNTGLTPAPECAASTDIPAGGRREISGLTVGNNRFQCCIHPWMRIIVKVGAHRDDEHGDNDD